MASEVLITLVVLWYVCVAMFGHGRYIMAIGTNRRERGIGFLSLVSLSVCVGMKFKPLTSAQPSAWLKDDPGNPVWLVSSLQITYKFG